MNGYFFALVRGNISDPRKKFRYPGIYGKALRSGIRTITEKSYSCAHQDGTMSAPTQHTAFAAGLSE